MKFGRRRPVAPHPHLKLGNYLKASFPASPASCDYSNAGGAALTDIFGNDALGDCVVAGGYHVTATETGNAGDLFHASYDQIISDYSAIGGFDPKNPDATDRGCLLTDALAYWSSHGFANGTKLLGYLAVDPTNQAEVMAACYLFENLYHAFELPDAWVNPMPNGDGFVWDIAPPNPQNGHCVMSVGYDSNGVKIDSWGLFGTVTWKALAALGAASAGGELWVMLTPDQLTRGQSKAPNGIAWGDLLTDFNNLGGHVPVIGPPPPVTPAPYGTVVTADMATAWLKAAFDAAHPILDRAQAEAIVASTLAARWPQTP